jgi:hypothetical protein
VQSLLVGHHGDAEARVLDQPLLHGVVEDGVLARAQEDPGRLVAQLRGAGELAQPVGDERAGARGIELAGGVGDLLLPLPDGEGLRDLLVEGHAREEIPHALVHRTRAIAIERGVLRERGRRRREPEPRPSV